MTRQTARLTRRLFGLAALASLAACAPSTETATLGKPAPLGEFKLGHIVVVADNVQKVQPSRDVSVEQWESTIKAALERRLKGHDGDQFYHVAVNVLGYSVAVPGVPVVLAPKSVMVVEASIWDDAAGGKINAEPKQFTVWESVNPDFVLGSGLTKNRDEQVANLSANVAKQVEEWMRDNPKWFAAKN